MPELPEVQTTVNGINRYVKGFSVIGVWTDYESPFHKNKEDIKNPAYFRRFKKSVVGARIEEASRRGKNILIRLSNGNSVLIHMKMTGHIMYGTYKKQKNVWFPATNDVHLNDPFNRFIHLVFFLSNGNHLVLSDMRKFAKVVFLPTDSLNESEHVKKHGPEPLAKDFGKVQLKKALTQRPNLPIKTALMDHTLVAGIGNIYSDEILWRVDIHPLTRVKNAPQKTWILMLRAIQKTLKEGIDFGGDSMSDYRDILGRKGTFQGKHNAYQKTGEKCGKKGCTGIIKRLKMGGRSAHFCDKHQKLYT